jgi:clan AA aspartic protease
MSLVHAEIELINGGDLAMVQKKLMNSGEIKQIKVKALVDKRFLMLFINEKIQEKLQFPVVKKRKAQMANGHIIECDVVAPVELRFKNRQTTCRAMVLPGDAEVLLGAIPFEDMDVLIDAQRQELIVNPDHPYFAQMKMK